MVDFDVLQGIGLRRSMGTNGGGAVFGIRKVEYGAPFRGMLLGNSPNGVYLQVWEGRGEERASCVA